MEICPDDLWMEFQERPAPSPQRIAGRNNVVPLRPSQRRYTYADFILSALCAADEAQAAGEIALTVARIKLVYHLLEDVARRRNG